MALRIGWGDQAMFVISRRRLPSGVPGDPARPAVHAADQHLAAVGRQPAADGAAPTSRSRRTRVQSGARVELYAAACGFNIYGFLGYDLLVQFNPFHFIADIYAGLALRWGTDVLAGVSVHCELSGPAPWQALGEASIEILFFEITVGLRRHLGRRRAGPDRADGGRAAAGADGAVRRPQLDGHVPGQHPRHRHAASKIEQPPDRIVLHPFGVLAVSQKVVPLGVEINKFGNRRPAGATPLRADVRRRRHGRGAGGVRHGELPPAERQRQARAEVVREDAQRPALRHGRQLGRRASASRRTSAMS